MAALRWLSNRHEGVSWHAVQVESRKPIMCEMRWSPKAGPGTGGSKIARGVAEGPTIDGGKHPQRHEDFRIHRIASGTSHNCLNLRVQWR